jgi:glycyl-tRNA synthetase
MKRRGFIFRSSDIYGGVNGVFDYGPLGVELKRNITEAWWTDVMKRGNDVVGLYCSIISPDKVWKSSGHIAGFSDTMANCRESKMHLRADQLFFANVIVDNELIGHICVQECDDVEDAPRKAAEVLKRKLKK